MRVLTQKLPKSLIAQAAKTQTRVRLVRVERQGLV
jgi:hypothetical protein